ncbi:MULTISPECIES: nitrite reductase [Mumia]|uniref:Nitrite reductase n=1 Tax=Mumia xiangluensis TaxID=1678900 RepID=A0ABW1QSD4_9ACTN|nr:MULTISPECIES: nitrite reductase [Mumia]
MLRPWLAEDGAIVRVRVPGGKVGTTALGALLDVAERWGDGKVLLTSRANLQLRALPTVGDQVPGDVVAAIEAAGLLPSRSHERIRNVVVSPLTGRLGGLADLRPAVRALDAVLTADPALAALPGRFLFVLDDGGGDVVDRPLDLGLMAIDAERAQLRTGSDVWGPVVPLDESADAVADLARAFLDHRGDGEDAWWHVDELHHAGGRLLDPWPREASHRTTPPPPYGLLGQDDGRTAVHVAVPEGLLTRDLFGTLEASGAGTLVVTPWRSIVAVDLETSS